MGENIKWYFPNENSVSDKLVDEFADSKFNIDRWTSFAREIIQNSLDVANDKLCPRKPVIVSMDYKEFSLSDIPGGVRLLDILKKAEVSATNKQTKLAYQKGIEILESDNIVCMKVSDFNTIGVKAGRDAEWGALVYDEGKSKKKRAGSAGSHGVGKKAPFIISAVNTVFYSTLNEDNVNLFQGKCSLVNWTDDDGLAKTSKGWYGKTFEESEDRRNRVQPLSGEELDFINPFFVRKDELGTDVIIVGVKMDEIDAVKSKIINAVLENFFVAIDRKILEVNVFGENINKDNLDDIITKYYQTTAKNLTRLEGGNLRAGNLKNYYNAYAADPVRIPIKLDNILYGYANIFFELANDKNKKYYCIFREHGMKIRDVNVSSDQAFSAVVIIENPEESSLPKNELINARLSDVENAAHDDFVINNDDYECDEITKKLVNIIYSLIEDFIKGKTEIKATDETPLEALSEMVAIQGVVSPKARREKPKVVQHKNKVKTKSKGQRASNYDDGVTSAGGGDKKRKKPGGQNKPAKEGNDFNATIYKNFAYDPLFIHTKDEFILKICCNENVDSSDVQVFPISVDGNRASIDNIVISAKSDDKEYVVKNNIIKNVTFKSSKEKKIIVKIKNNFNYSLDCEVMVGDKHEN